MCFDLESKVKSGGQSGQFRANSEQIGWRGASGSGPGKSLWGTKHFAKGHVKLVVSSRILKCLGLSACELPRILNDFMVS